MQLFASSHLVNAKLVPASRQPCIACVSNLHPPGNEHLLQQRGRPSCCSDHCVRIHSFVDIHAARHSAADSTIAAPGSPSSCTRTHGSRQPDHDAFARPRRKHDRGDGARVLTDRGSRPGPAPGPGSAFPPAHSRRGARPDSRAHHPCGRQDDGSSCRNRDAVTPLDRLDRRSPEAPPAEGRARPHHRGQSTIGIPVTKQFANVSGIPRPLAHSITPGTSSLSTTPPQTSWNVFRPSTSSKKK